MTKKELKALRRPFVRELFRNNKFNLAMTVLAAVLTSVVVLITSWMLKAVSDVIAGVGEYPMGTLLLIAGGTIALMVAAMVVDRAFLSRFRVRAMEQYRAYAFDRLMEKGIQAFSGENSSLYISALSNDVNAIETDFIGRLQSTIQVGITFVGALGLMLWCSPLLTMIAIGFSLLPILVSVVLGNKAAIAEKNVSDQKRAIRAC